jgi:hypothetical protein
LKQGCQIFVDTTYQNGKNIPKWKQNIPIGHKIYEMAIKWPNGHKIYQHLSSQETPKCTQIGIFWIYTIWQPWFKKSRLVWCADTFQNVLVIFSARIFVEMNQFRIVFPTVLWSKFLGCTANIADFKDDRMNKYILYIFSPI